MEGVSCFLGREGLGSPTAIWPHHMSECKPIQQQKFIDQLLHKPTANNCQKHVPNSFLSAQTTASCPPIYPCCPIGDTRKPKGRSAATANSLPSGYGQRFAIEHLPKLASFHDRIQSENLTTITKITNEPFLD